MARKQTLDAILSLFKKLGGNTSEVLGTKTNVNFLYHIILTICNEENTHYDFNMNCEKHDEYFFND